MYTMDDHRADPLRYPACSLEHVWRQRGNRTGHCSRCHETFEGMTAFTAHQSTGDDGRTICADPASLTVHGHPLRLIDGSWRGPGMPESVIAGHRNPPTGSCAPEG